MKLIKQELKVEEAHDNWLEEAINDKQWEFAKGYRAVRDSIIYKKELNTKDLPWI